MPKGALIRPILVATSAVARANGRIAKKASKGFLHSFCWAKSLFRVVREVFIWAHTSTAGQAKRERVLFFLICEWARWSVSNGLSDQAPSFFTAAETEPSSKRILVGWWGKRAAVVVPLFPLMKLKLLSKETEFCYRLRYRKDHKLKAHITPALLISNWRNEPIPIIVATVLSA